MLKLFKNGMSVLLPKKEGGGRRRKHSLENELGSAMVTDAVAPRLLEGLVKIHLVF